MFKNWRVRQAQKKALEEAARNDAYLMRLKNSARGFCGTRHSGEGPFLKLEEVQILIRNEFNKRQAI